MSVCRLLSARTQGVAAAGQPVAGLPHIGLGNDYSAVEVASSITLYRTYIRKLSSIL